MYIAGLSAYVMTLSVLDITGRSAYINILDIDVLDIDVLDIDVLDIGVLDIDVLDMTRIKCTMHMQYIRYNRSKFTMQLQSAMQIHPSKELLCLIYEF